MVGSSASPPPTATTNVIITVTDVNDNPPVFARDNYVTAVNEEAPPGTVILSLDTTDADTGVNADVSYFITKGDQLGRFEVNKGLEMNFY